jgi:uncharacterized protein YndB with AHSA1/START domain
MAQKITVETVVACDIESVWRAWAQPKDICAWNHASPDWECPHAENDVRPLGRFLFRMSARDGSVSFDFTGSYTAVEKPRLIAYTMDDGRTAQVVFTKQDNAVHISETFEMEQENSEELQRKGWQAILDNFKKYAEGSCQ